MSASNATATKNELLSKEVIEKIDVWIAKYPVEQRQSAVIPALHIAQDANEGWLTNDLMDAVASYLKMPNISVYEVATFYSMFELSPVGKNKISVCTNISCMLRGSEDIVAHLTTKLASLLPNPGLMSGIQNGAFIFPLKMGWFLISARLISIQRVSNSWVK